MYDLIIIGSGPAGLTAAIYAGRARLKTLVIGGITWGGQLMLTQKVENFPGFPEGIPGSNLMENMRKQAEKFEVKVIFEEVTSVDFSTCPFKINVRDNSFDAKAVIIATGALNKRLGLDAENKLIGRGISFCAVCDSPFFKDKRVMVIGGGDSAMEEALFLSKHAQEVTIVHRRDQLRASKILQERVFANKRINIIWNSMVEDILGQDRVKGIRLRNVKTGGSTTFTCDGLFIAIGYKPNTNVFKGKIALDEDGYIIVHDDTKTSIEGIFAAGDNQDGKYKQAITSASSGCKAALDAEKYLQKKSLKKRW